MQENNNKQTTKQKRTDHNNNIKNKHITQIYKNINKNPPKKKTNQRNKQQ